MKGAKNLDIAKSHAQLMHKILKTSNLYVWSSLGEFGLMFAKSQKSVKYPDISPYLYGQLPFLSA